MLINWGFLTSTKIFESKSHSLNGQTSLAYSKGMRRNLKASLKFTLAREGGYQCGRADRGNWTGGKLGVGQLSGTKYGISAMLLSEIRGEAVSAATMKALTPDVFYDVATSRFWNVLDCNELPDGVDLMLFDFGFNSGTERAIKQLQQLLGMSMAAQDGEMGPATLTALHEASTATIMSFLSRKYLEQFQSWLDLPSGQVSMTSLIDAVGEHCARDNLIIYALASQQEAAYRSFRTFKTYGQGWLTRLAERVAEAHRLAQAADGVLA